MQSKRILIVGDVFVDVNVANRNNSQNVHLGGIFHSARAFSVIHSTYGICYTAPPYLESSITKFSEILNCSYRENLATVDGAPNVILIRDRFEAGNQEYSEILRDQYKLNGTNDFEKVIQVFQPTDVLLYPIKEYTEQILHICNKYKINIHIDVQYIDNTMNFVQIGKYDVRSLMLSTSTSYFINDCKKDVSILKSRLYKSGVKLLILKENRGGSRIIDLENDITYDIPCYPIEIKHSIGLGDCYNSVFIANDNGNEFEIAGKMASFIASLYSCTYDYNLFKDLVSKFMSNSIESLKQLTGQRLAWEDRANTMIYIAAPDFPDVDTRIIDQIEENLVYHGFPVHRPIKENGLAKADISRAEELAIFEKDIVSLDNSDLMIAILLQSDPGTLVEIGYFFKSNKPIILFDPNKIAMNMFLMNSVSKVCYSMDEVTDSVFTHLSRR
ncbi:MAG: nucleoside 2-deoxyribosyltransferase [Candidatus Cloacimonetes bacterium]|nr:nucleoside 2-deoxyribosyltransferase [Candidatus Cloacimonadota bacterium]